MIMPSFEAAFDFSDKVVIVTGGAAGIGLAMARTFAERGARLCLLDRAPDVEAQARALPGAGHVGVVADMTDTPALARFVERVTAEQGRIDVLLNNAGIVRLAPAAALSEADWDMTLAINLRAPFMMAQLVGRQMLLQGSGRIVNMASQAALIGIEQHVAYSASKAAVVSMTKTLALEWGPHGVTVNAISPTVVETELGKKAWAGEVGEALKRQIPTRRFAQPAEVALAALYLASGAAGMVNGENLVIDGGFTIQ